MDKDRPVSVLEKDVFQERLNQVSEEYSALVKTLSAIEARSDEFKKALKRIGELEELVKLKEESERLDTKISEAERILGQALDKDLQALAEEELVGLREQQAKLRARLTDHLFPGDPEDQKNAFMEIRPGTGGEEACLFARDLFRMYARYCEKAGYQLEIYNSHFSDLGGIKEVVFLVKGRGAYGVLKSERGVHRVQRIPETEASGRIHTSAATCAVFPEVQDEEVRIDPKDLKIDTFCASGPGGQHVNKTASAVRITHIPTALAVSCQEERSQLQNRARAMKILKVRLQYLYNAEKKAKIDSERKQQVRTGDRSEKIRTYNFPQNRLTDHRAGVTMHNLDRVMEGELDELFARLKTVRS